MYTYTYIYTVCRCIHVCIYIHSYIQYNRCVFCSRYSQSTPPLAEPFPSNSPLHTHSHELPALIVSLITPALTQRRMKRDRRKNLLSRVAKERKVSFILISHMEQLASKLQPTLTVELVPYPVPDIYIDICGYVYIHVCIYICVYVYIYVCIHI